ncbi:quinone-dependent dihydroorotate dehydrogenase [Pseudomarimonas salicorniae]|uniref:Dihydroorotate dehydrogenase (quinone) n=1 Tax=Pseudomarimonas salicorniae TaxID=2933270 RepID=A0ABT0GF32_9GAMM|nr:quinone-dependent dihydroorotate dehydrogenase [Lysobacter sp. CAU 1642]
MYPLFRPFLFSLDPERAHALGLKAIDTAWRLGLRPLVALQPRPLKTKAFGLEFPNPVGLAAGMDKNGEYIDALAALGFGFIEIGTTTPRPQEGNPKPRMFRLPRAQGVINRLGFNNAGVDALVRNVEASRFTGILGINIGKNRDTSNQNAVNDYLYCLQKVYPLASYVTINISSPNTQGLRDLQGEDALRRLLGRLRDAQETLGSRTGTRKPMLVKIAPDLDDGAIDNIAKVLTEAKVDGVIATNTTVSRTEVEGQPHASEEGGLSGKPLYGHSTYVLRRLRAHLPKSMPVIGVGGILSGADAAGKIAAGATLVQMYTGLIYRGPDLVRESVDAIRRRREAPSSTG